MDLFSLEDSHANHTQTQESDLEQKMTDISGLKCLESYQRLNPNGLLGKMFADLLVGMPGWYSSKCRLTWKLKGTKYGRFYFQLVPSTLPTEGTGFGLWRTPSVQEPGVKVDRLVTKEGEPAKIGERAYDKHTGRLAQVGLTQQVQMKGLIPTPTAMDSSEATATMKSSQVKEGSMHSVTLVRALKMELLPTPREAASRGNCSNDRGKGNLEDVIAKLIPTPQTQGLKVSDQNGKTQFMDLTLLPTPTTGADHATQYKQGGKFLRCFLGDNGMLPTPTTRDANGIEHSPSQKDKNRLAPDIGTMFQETHGKTSQLNHLFVEEMMGFPENWCEPMLLKIAEDYLQKKKSTQSFQKRLKLSEKQISKPTETQ